MCAKAFIICSMSHTDCVWFRENRLSIKVKKGHSILFFIAFSFSEMCNNDLYLSLYLCDPSSSRLLLFSSKTHRHMNTLNTTKYLHSYMEWVAYHAFAIHLCSTYYYYIIFYRILSIRLNLKWSSNECAAPTLHLYTMKKRLHLNFMNLPVQRSSVVTNAWRCYCNVYISFYLTVSHSNPATQEELLV